MSLRSSREGGLGLQSVQMLGVLSALKTGDPNVDAFLAISAPFLISFFLEHSRSAVKMVWAYLFPRRAKLTHRRTITYRPPSAYSNCTSMDIDTSKNEHLVTGIKFFVHYKSNLKQLREVGLDLTDTLGAGTTNMSDDDEFSGEPNTLGYEDDECYHRAKGKITSKAGLLRTCQIVKRPIDTQLLNVGYFHGYHVYMTLKDSIDNDGKGTGNGNNQGQGSGQRKIQILLESEGANSIDVFVETAFHWYMGELKKLETKDRYLYDFCHTNSSNSYTTISGRSAAGTPLYNRYRLGDEKTFETLFSPQTRSLLKIVDNFQQKQGRFAIPGFPHKLGILLHGAPGTGKTSLIKALANYTNRHIVNVPLARLSTNQQLMSVFFNKTYTSIAGQAVAMYGFKDVIFVLEDVDATSQVVARRKVVTNATSVTASSDKTSKGQGSELNDSDTKKKNKQADAAAKKRAFTEALESSGLDFRGLRADLQTVARMKALQDQKDNTDKLSLAGLLNVLDGVVDTPGRIVIMTTNYPELLDPALTRPGRIDKKLELGCMEWTDAVAMLGHYFETLLSENQKTRLEELMGGEETPYAVTPAEMEQYILQEDTIDEVIQSLVRAQQLATSQHHEDVHVIRVEDVATNGFSKDPNGSVPIPMIPIKV